MKILLTGFGGYVGSLVRRGLAAKHELIGVSSKALEHNDAHIRCDLGNERAVEHLATQVQPDTIVHAAGLKDIRFCEQQPGDAFRANATSVTNLVRAFGDRCRIIYVSTDYVFAGEHGGYGEDDACEPRTVYGQSKLRGEQQGGIVGGNDLVVLRSSAIYDLRAAFPTMLLDALSKGQRVECYSDVYYSPTYYRDFVAALERLLAHSLRGRRVFHICGETSSRYEFAQHFARTFGFGDAQILAAREGGASRVLFPDLSMRDETTRTALGLDRTPLVRALSNLREELLSAAE